MQQYDIYAIGGALVDTEIEVSDQDLVRCKVEKGVMTLVDEARQAELTERLEDCMVASKRASGGSGANSIIAASYFGASTFYSCKVANDENGRFYLNDLSDANVDFHNLAGAAEGTTGKCLVMITPDAERSMNTFLGVSETLSVHEIDVSALKSARYVYIEGYLVTSETSRPAAIKLRELAEEHGAKTALSLSDPAIVEFFHSGLTDIIGSGVDLLFCNEEEAMSYTKADTLNDALEKLKTIARTYAVTRGAKGALIFDGETLHDLPAKPVKAIDSNGAGDMFAGAFLAALSQGKTYPEAGAFAGRAASVVVSQFGPRLRPEQHKELLKTL